MWKSLLAPLLRIPLCTAESAVIIMEHLGNWVMKPHLEKSYKTSTFFSSLGELWLPELPSLENFFFQLGAAAPVHFLSRIFGHQSTLLKGYPLYGITAASTYLFRYLFKDIASAAVFALQDLLSACFWSSSLLAIQVLG